VIEEVRVDVVYNVRMRVVRIQNGPEGEVQRDAHGRMGILPG